MSYIENQLSKNPYWEDLKSVSQKIFEQGFSVVLAGGGVRDALLGLPSTDFDLATSATPEDLKKIFPQAKQVWSHYGVSLVPYENFNSHVDVTTFRKEFNYQDARHPNHIEYCSMAEDAQRRDFTINALFYDIQKKEVIDLVDGLRDLKNKTIKTVGDPEQRFTEDHLRLLRALRFAHQFQFSIEDQTSKAIKKLIHKLESVSQERKTNELLKMLSKASKNYQENFLSCSQSNHTKHDLMRSSLAPALKLLDDYRAVEILFLLPVKKPKNPYMFWRQSFSFLKEPSYLWAVIGLPYFFENNSSNDAGSGFEINKDDKQQEISFQKFLQNLKISSKDLKQSQFYFQSVHALLSQKIKLIEKIKILNQDEKSLKEIMWLWLEYLGQDKQNLKDLFNDFDSLKKSHGGSLPKALVTGSDLLAHSYREGKQFKKILDKAFEYQLKNPKATKTEILNSLKK